MHEANKNSTCVIPVLPLNDSLRTVNKNEITKVESRKNKFLVQTPQLCNYKELLIAHDNTTQIYDDESSLLMSKGTKITTVEGDPRILKITYENDFKLLKPYLTNNIKYITMIGNGFDIHRFDLKKDNIKIKDIELSFVGYLSTPISLGDLRGNEFTIIIRGVNNIKNRKIMPNFFDDLKINSCRYLKPRFNRSASIFAHSKPCLMRDISKG